MAALRATAPGPDLVEQRREAYMRKTIRAVLKEGFGRIAVVCGAWHAPALAELGPAKTDDAILKALPKIKVEASWIPWTHSRLSFRSGYGAGVGSPGWYAHLWTSPDRAPIRWVAQAAQLLRGEDLDASPASVIDTVRLPPTLRALGGAPAPCARGPPGGTGGWRALRSCATRRSRSFAADARRPSSSSMTGWKSARASARC